MTADAEPLPQTKKSSRLSAVCYFLSFGCGNRPICGIRRNRDGFYPIRCRSGASARKVSYLIAYYPTHKPDDSDWVVPPVVSFDAYFGGTAFSKKISSHLTKNIIIRDRTGYGVSRYKVSQELIWEELEHRELRELYGE